MANIKVIDWVGPEAETTVNAAGGRQSKLNYRFDLIDPVPMFALARILAEGAAKYGEWNWRRISLNDNLNHAISHLFAYLSGDEQDEHLEHAFCRLLFALSLKLTPGEVERMKPDD